MIQFRQPFKNDYPITLDFGEEWLPMYKKGQHKGIDYGCPTGTQILATADGTAMIVGYQANGYGHYVILSHTNGYSSIYAHLSAISVKQGQTVKQGDQVGLSGSSGNSSGPHLHFEIHDNTGKVIDPKTVLRNVIDDYPVEADPDSAEPEQGSELIGAEALGRRVYVSAPAGVRAFVQNGGDWEQSVILPYGTQLEYDNIHTERSNGLTYCRVSLWCAVHDKETQILNNIGG